MGRPSGVTWSWVVLEERESSKEVDMLIGKVGVEARDLEAGSGATRPGSNVMRLSSSWSSLSKLPDTEFPLLLLPLSMAAAAASFLSFLSARRFRSFSM